MLGVCFCIRGASLLEDTTSSLYLGYRHENMRICEEQLFVNCGRAMMSVIRHMRMKIQDDEKGQMVTMVLELRY